VQNFTYSTVAKHYYQVLTKVRSKHENQATRSLAHSFVCFVVDGLTIGDRDFPLKIVGYAL